MHRLRSLVVVGVVAVAVSAVAVGPAAAAKGGNNDTAKVCQKGRWQALVPDTDGTFANQGDCVNDGAQGSPPFGTAGSAECGKIGGRFAIMFIPEPPARTEWECEYMVPPNPTHPPGLQNACSADVDGAVGVFETEQINGGDQWIALCAEFP